MALYSSFKRNMIHASQEVPYNFDKWFLLKRIYYSHSIAINYTMENFRIRFIKARATNKKKTHLKIHSENIAGNSFCMVDIVTLGNAKKETHLFCWLNK